MKSSHTASVKAIGEQATAVRRAYSAPLLTTFGSVSALTAGGSGGRAEFNMMGTGMNQMRARP